MKIEESDAEITADSLPRVRVDAGQVRQVLQNLLDNPGEAMAISQLIESPEGLEIRLGDEDRVRETVEQLRQRAKSLSRRV